MNDKQLTNEEKEILTLLSLGETYKYIRQKMNLSEHKVRTIRNNMLKKLNARNADHAIYLAFSQGLLEIAD